MAEGELGDRAADAPLDLHRPEGDLVLAVALAPLLGAVGIADRHSHDRDRLVYAADRHDAGDAPSGAHDDVTADLLAQDPVRAADVVLALGRDGGRLQPETRLPDSGRGLVDDLILCRTPRVEGQVEAGQLELEADDVGREYAQRLLQQLLPGLVPLEPRWCGFPCGVSLVTGVSSSRKRGCGVGRSYVRRRRQGLSGRHARGQ